MHVAVIGAGPAGCAAAIALRRRGCAVTVIGDAVDAVGEQLAPSARPVLQRLGLLPLRQHLECVGVRAAWESTELHSQDYLFHPLGRGWLLDRATFGTQLRQAAAAAGAELRVPARLHRLERCGSGWRAEDAMGELACDWIIDATGRSARTARLLGVGRRCFDRQVALVGWLQSDTEDEDATLTVESAVDGWWYTCRLPGGRRVAAWVTSSRPDRDTWAERLRATLHVAPLLRGYRLERALVARAAGSSLLERVCGPGWIAIGDAAASYDPLASRGLVAALEAGAGVADLVGSSESRLEAHREEVEARFHRYLGARREYYAPPSEAGRGSRVARRASPSPDA